MSVTQLQPATYGAQRLGIDLQRFYALTRERKLPDGVVIRIGRTIRVDPARLEEFIANGGCPLPGGWRREAA
jgi:hypothetical protein